MCQNIEKSFYIKVNCRAKSHLHIIILKCCISLKLKRDNIFAKVVRTVTKLNRQKCNVPVNSIC